MVLNRWLSEVLLQSQFQYFGQLTPWYNIGGNIDGTFILQFLYLLKTPATASIVPVIISLAQDAWAHQLIFKHCLAQKKAGGPNIFNCSCHPRRSFSHLLLICELVILVHNTMQAESKLRHSDDQKWHMHKWSHLKSQKHSRQNHIVSFFLFGLFLFGRHLFS